MEILCKHFNDCGGCDSQDKDYPEQLRIKEDYVRELFSESANISIDKIIPSPEIWHYRNKMEYIVGEESGIVSAGLRRKRKYYTIVDLEECRIFHKDVAEVFGIFKKWIADLNIETYSFFKRAGTLRYIGMRHSKFHDETMIIVVIASTHEKFEEEKDKYLELAGRLKGAKNIKSLYVCLNSGVADVAVTGSLVLLHGEDSIKERINGIDYLIDPASFFQTNSFCCERLYRVIVAEAGKDRLCRNAIDLYCGSGGITLQLAKDFEKVIGIDISEKNIKNAVKNTSLNKIENVEFITEDAEKFLSRSGPSFLSGSSSVMIIDPPRSGLGKKVKSIIIASLAPRVIYVSCNPKNLVQDLKALAGAYTVEKVIPLDMFPHTRHLEVVAVLKRSDLSH